MGTAWKDALIHNGAFLLKETNENGSIATGPRVLMRILLSVDINS